MPKTFDVPQFEKHRNSFVVFNLIFPLSLLFVPFTVSFLFKCINSELISHHLSKEAQTLIFLQFSFSSSVSTSKSQTLRTERLTFVQQVAENALGAVTGCAAVPLAMLELPLAFPDADHVTMHHAGHELWISATDFLLLLDQALEMLTDIVASDNTS